MDARTVQRAETDLGILRSEARWDWLVAGLALGAAIAASKLLPELALPLLVGGVAVGARGARAFWQRCDLIDRLLPERDAYLIGEIRFQAEQMATPASRRELADSIRHLLEEPEYARPGNLAPVSGELAALASELEDEELALDPACAVACKNLLVPGAGSPLFGPACAPEDLRAQIWRIRSGFDRVQAAV